MQCLHDWISKRAAALAAAVLAGALLAACGGGGGDNSVAPAAPSAPSGAPIVPTAGAPVFVGDTAIDGLNWFNYRRGQLGVPALAHNTVIDAAALAHANYLKLNNTITHVETSGLPGFSGAQPLDRLTAAGYRFGNAGYAYGEVISATSNASGVFMAEELITAIYHRFVIFEPAFKEIGTGAASASSGYHYFVADFAANNGYGPGIGRGQLALWPYDGQTGVPNDFFSDYESPDPVPGANEVGYPVSVHADINVAVTVQSFSLREHGAGTDLAVKLLSAATDADTPRSAAAIVPLAVLKGATRYDVSFTGATDGANLVKSWSFTTK